MDVWADPQAVESVERLLEHVGANEIDLKKERLILGRPLRMDTRNEYFPSDDEANRMLTRKYRQSFVVPSQV